MSLKLVSSFSPADYIYSFSHTYDDHLDGDERHRVMQAFRCAATVARLEDYRILDEDRTAAIYLKDPADIQKFTIAREPVDYVEHEFVQAEQEYDVRKLKRGCHKLQRLADEAGFHDKIIFAYVPRQRAIILEARTKKDYFDFDAYLGENKDRFQRYFDLQRKEIEMTVPTPAAGQESIVAVKIFDKDPITPYPASDLFIRGGATDETATPPRDVPLSLAKDFSPDTYRFKLTPSVAYDPTRSSTDNLFRFDADYPAFKREVKNDKMAQQIRNAMEKAEVDDYYLSNEGGQVRAWFTRPDDLAVAYAAIMPDMGYKVDFLQCSRYASAMKINTKMKRLQAIFTEADRSVNVQFVADRGRNVIQAQTDNTEDFIRVQGMMRRLERTNDQFQRLVGLS